MSWMQLFTFTFYEVLGHMRLSTKESYGGKEWNLTKPDTRKSSEPAEWSLEWTNYITTFHA